MHTLAELYFAAVLPGAGGSAEGLGSINLLRLELCARGFKVEVFEVEGAVWCARAFRESDVLHEGAKSC